MHRRALGLLLALGLVPAGSWAAGLRANVNRTEATVEDQILLTLTVEGSRSATPSLPELPDFDVFPRGRSTQLNWVNGKSSSSVTYNYILVPRRPGVFTLGAATVELDGEAYSSLPIEVKILRASAKPRDTRDVFVTAAVSTKTPFVGQQVIYTWRFYRRVPVGEPNLEGQDFDGFVVEPLGEVREYSTTVNGISYTVSEIRRALFPQEVGPLSIPASRLTCRVALPEQRRRRRSAFDDFFGATPSETKVFRTREIDLEVRDLPAQPGDFSGLVGSFEIEAHLSQKQVKVGESTTLRIKISGSGNVAMISEPSIPDLGPFKVYGDKPTATVNRSGANLQGSRTYSKALVPLQAGGLRIPSISLVFFDPEVEDFRTSRTEPQDLVVLEGTGEEELRLTEALAPGSGKVAVRILADDVLPIYEGLDAIDQGLTGWGWLAAFWAGLILAPVAFLATVMVGGRRRRFDMDKGLEKRAKAFRSARRRLRRLARDSGGPHSGAGQAGVGDSGERASALLREYIGDKLGVEGLALTPEDADSLLRDRGVDEALGLETAELLRELEAARFGVANVAGDDVVERVAKLVKQLERRIRVQ